MTPPAKPLVGAAVVFVMLLGGCSSTPTPPQDLARDLSGKVGVDGMFVHLRKLQEIADANDGSRAEGTPGYDASVDYVAQTCGTRVSTFRRRNTSGSAWRGRETRHSPCPAADTPSTRPRY